MVSSCSMLSGGGLVTGCHTMRRMPIPGDLTRGGVKRSISAGSFAAAKRYAVSATLSARPNFS